MSLATAPVEFDPFSDEYFDDPTTCTGGSATKRPCTTASRYGFYALSRFADVLAAHRDWQTFSSAHGIDVFMLRKNDPEEVASYRQLIMMDPPEHDRFRALVSRVFTPRAVSGLEPMIRDVIGGYLDGLQDPRAFDAVADLAAPFPIEVISRMLGVPEEDRQGIRHCLDAGLHREPGQMEPSPENMQAQLENGIYFHELTAEKRKRPADDMLSRLTQVTVDRGDGTETGLDDTEIAGFASLLGGAGAETVTKLVGNAVVLFHRHPDQWQKIRRRPREDPAGRRGDPPVLAALAVPGPLLRRGTDVRGEWHGPGWSPGPAHHGSGDPRPPRVRARRRVRHRTAAGDHDRSRSRRARCLGAALARMESRIAIEELATRWRRLEVDEAGLRRVQMANVAGYSNVPVRGVR